MKYVITLAVFLSTLSISQAQEKAERPNVLWIYLEDVSGWFSSYGDTLIQTPNMDALAQSGIRFDRYYATAGVCSPSRSAVVTGMMQTSIGAHHHRSARSNFRGLQYDEYDKNELPDHVVPLPIRFKQAGYWTFNDGNKDDYNFEWDAKAFYDYYNPKPWGLQKFINGECLAGNTDGKPFFGQIQLGGGKLRNRAPKIIDPSTVSVPPYYPDVAEVRKEIAHHYDCLLETDKQVGQIIDYLKENGLYENTVIFMFSDHGMKLHRHKQFLYEGGIRLPFVLSGPGINGQQINSDLISGIDISATSLAVAGIGIPASMEGRDILSATYQERTHVIAARDRCDETIDKIRAVITPKYKYLLNYYPERPYMQPSYKDPWPVSKKFRAMMAAGEMNTTQLLFFGPTKAPEELYDLENDPHEIHNLAQDPNYKNELEQHRKLLFQWIAETGDQGQIPESDLALKCVMERRGAHKCIAPEYDRVKASMDSEK
ncbi:sulfatase family protein [Sediminicola luteus]|uniref:Sulfatase n=1 Tax=Sediminicola luteus TaxID=319238 RepID=A0A2A4G9I7_9FLAO|nr:sulfatase [Sediminicola luteus]PCE64425.1 sulfatase [Sediminicola luteus]